MRVLVSSTAGAGHFAPLAPAVDALTRRGDEVLLVVPPGLREAAEASGHAVRLGADPPTAEMEEFHRLFPTLPPGEAAVLANRELFGRMCTAAMLPAVEAAVHDWRPRFVLREPCEYAAAIAADRAGVAHAQVAISLAGVERSALDLAAPAVEHQEPGIAGRIRAAPYLTRFPPSLDPSPFPVTLRFREDDPRPPAPMPDWWGGDGRPLVYVTFGSVAGGLPVTASAYRAAVDAVAGLPVRVLLTIGRSADPATLGAFPANVHVGAWVPQADVLAHAAAVVCHGGSGTTFGALAAGVPVVVVPLFADQPANGRRVAATGAGIVVEPAAGSAAGIAAVAGEDVPRIRAAVEALLAEPAHREAAARIAAEMRAQPAIEDALAAATGGALARREPAPSGARPGTRS